MLTIIASIVRATVIAYLCAVLLFDGGCAEAIPVEEAAASTKADVSATVAADSPSAKAEPSPVSVVNDATPSDAEDDKKSAAADQGDSKSAVASDPITIASVPKAVEQKTVSSDTPADSANEVYDLNTRSDVTTKDDKNVESSVSAEPQVSSSLALKDAVTLESKPVEVSRAAADEKPANDSDANLKGATDGAPSDVSAALSVPDAVTAVAEKVSADDNDSTTSPKEADGAFRRKAGKETNDVADSVPEVTVSTISGRISTVAATSTPKIPVHQGSDLVSEGGPLEDADVQSRRSFNQMARKITSTVAHSTNTYQPHHVQFSTQTPRYIFQTIEVPFQYVIPTYTPYYNPIYNYYTHLNPTLGTPHYFSPRYGPHVGPNLFEPHPSTSPINYHHLANHHFAIPYPSQAAFHGLDLHRPRGYPSIFPSFAPRIGSDNFVPGRQFYSGSHSVASAPRLAFDTRPIRIGVAHHRPKHDGSKLFASVRVGDRTSSSGGTDALEAKSYNIAFADRSVASVPKGIDDSLVERIFQRREK